MTAAAASLAHEFDGRPESPSQSDPLTVSYICHPPIVVAHIAERRRYAALRRNRVAFASEKTLVRQAVEKAPASANPNVARGDPRRPAPTTNHIVGNGR